MLGAHLEQVAPYHWRITGRYIVEIKRVEILREGEFPSIKWEVSPEDCEHSGPPGLWGSAGQALAHAYSIATRDAFDTFRGTHPAAEHVNAGAPA